MVVNAVINVLNFSFSVLVKEEVCLCMDEITMKYEWCTKCGRRPLDKLQLKITDFGVTRKMTADANRFSTAGNDIIFIFLFGNLEFLKEPTPGWHPKHSEMVHGRNRQMSGHTESYYGNYSREKIHIKDKFPLPSHFK